MTVAPQPAKQTNHKKRNVILIIVGAVFAIALILWLLYYIFVGRFYVETDDAYVQGNQVMLTPQVASSVVAIYADNTDLVEQGQLVVELDKSNFLIALEEKKKNLANTVREVARLFENVGEQEALVEVRQSELDQQNYYLENRQDLKGTGAISVEDYETSSTNVSTAQANVTYALKQLTAAKVLVAGTTIESHPRVQAAVNELKEAYLNLIRCDVISPARGYVARRSVQVGDYVPAGTTLMMIVPLDFLWFDANYKETQLKNVRIGQPVEFTADLYGKGVTFHGTVLGFTGGTGSAFALLPAQNATGNWIKIVQRLPVRISIDPSEIKEHPLFIGLSIRSSIDVHDTNGRMLCLSPQIEPVYATFIYDRQTQELESKAREINEIIEANKS